MAFSSEDNNDNIKVLDDVEDVGYEVRLITMATTRMVMRMRMIAMTMVMRMIAIHLRVSGQSGKMCSAPRGPQRVLGAGP